MRLRPFACGLSGSCDLRHRRCTLKIPWRLNSNTPGVSLLASTERSTFPIKMSNDPAGLFLFSFRRHIPGHADGRTDTVTCESAAVDLDEVTQIEAMTSEPATVTRLAFEDGNVCLV